MFDSVTISTSAAADGSMSVGVSDDQRRDNRYQFLQKVGITAEQTILVHLKYDTDNFRRYRAVTSSIAGDGIISPSTLVADALFTNEKNLALLLPIADCIGAVLYDPDRAVIGLVHLGRHNLLQTGGTAAVEYMKTAFSTDAHRLRVFLSAAAGRDNYPLYDFDDRSLHQVAIEQLLAAGVRCENIQTDTRDTTKDDSLFSHSQFLKGNRSLDGRQAIVCMMRTSR